MSGFDFPQRFGMKSYSGRGGGDTHHLKSRCLFHDSEFGFFV